LTVLNLLMGGSLALVVPSVDANCVPVARIYK